MEVLAAAVGALVTVAGQILCSKMKLQSNHVDLKREMRSLMDRRHVVEFERRRADGQGQEIRAEVVTWLEDVEKLLGRTNLIPEPPQGSLNCWVGKTTLVRTLNNEPTKAISVLGRGGLGKTTLLKNLNIKNTSMQSFGTVIWATVSRNLEMRQVQTQIAKRLDLEVTTEEGMDRIAIRIHQRLMNEDKFLLILDDVWEKVDLKTLGVPQPEDHKGWDVAHLEEIKPFAKEIVRECCGLPLAIIVVGAAMRKKTRVELWEHALNELRRSVPSIKDIEDEVYKPLKWSYDSLQGNNIKPCFLYCSLFPEDFSIKVSQLVQCWLGEGLIVEQNHVDSVNTGIDLIEKLKDTCLLEDGADEGTVKMHDVVRDVAVWIALSSEGGCESLIRSGIGLSEISISEVLNLSDTSIQSLPLSLLQLGDLCALLLRDCTALEELPPLGVFSRLQMLDLRRTVRFDLSLRPNGGLAARSDLLPNLEELSLDSLGGLESSSELFGYRGLRFRKLKFLRVSSCEDMRYLFSCGAFIRTLPKLEVIKVSDCLELDELFNYDSGQNMDLDPVVPKLQTLELQYLRKLRSICRHKETWPCLEQVTVWLCEHLKRLPLSNQNAGTIKEIEGESEWWNALEWDDHETKSSLLPYFKSW
uniref:NB-ARC domain-containing protein n=1 Tax=Fagus sylvatica TaxID=28930 RepID=A0A2N9F406_FAGSY